MSYESPDKFKKDVSANNGILDTLKDIDITPTQLFDFMRDFTTPIFLTKDEIATLFIFSGLEVPPEKQLLEVTDFINGHIQHKNLIKLLDHDLWTPEEKAEAQKAIAQQEWFYSELYKKILEENQKNQ